MIAAVGKFSGRAVCAALVVACALVALPRETPAQGLGIALFERYLDALRKQVGIPGLAAAIVQDGRVVWEKGYGYADVARSIQVRPNTPFPIGDLSQTLAATVVLQCLDRGEFVLEDRMRRWTSALPEPDATVTDVLAHVSDASQGGAFHYDPDRFAALTDLGDWCLRQPYSRTLADTIFERLGMVDTVPGAALLDPDEPDRQWFGAARLARYEAVIGQMARPYVSSRRDGPTPGTYEPVDLDASTGVVSTVRDLALFDAALDGLVLLDGATLARAWTPVVTGTGTLAPTGLGWFVQQSGGQRLVWHFGELAGAYSSLMLKAPDRRLTLILLANSDGLSAPFDLSEGDVTMSLFARLFLRLTS